MRPCSFIVWDRIVSLVRLLGGILILSWSASPVAGQQNPSGQLPIGNLDNPLVFLLRDPVVLDDLKAQGAQRERLRKLGDEIDGVIWPARNQTTEKANEAWREATRQAEVVMNDLLDRRQQQRLEQIKLWIQGTAALARDDVAEKLKLTPSQRRKLGEIMQATRETVEALQKRAREGEPVAPLEAEARKEKLAEQRQVNAELTPAQRNEWIRLIGPKIDVAKLGYVSFAVPAIVGEPNEWLNTGGRVPGLQGRVLAVHFFAHGCINCQRNYEHYRGWQEAFAAESQGSEGADNKLLIVGIHTPETAAEHDVARLEAKVKEAGFAFPILVDNQRRNWNAWGNSMWPSVYLVDRQGRIRFWWYGELNWQGQEGEKQLRARLRELLTEVGH